MRKLQLSIWMFLWSTCFVSAQKFDVIKLAKTDDHVELTTSEGIWKFYAYPNQIIKTTFKGNNSTRNEQVSNTVIVSPLMQPAKLMEYAGGKLIEWPNGSSIFINGSGISYSPTNELYIKVVDVYQNDSTRGLKFLLQPDEKIFGSGSRSLPLNRRGYRVPLKNNAWYGYQMNADALNYSVPFILSNKHYGIFYDNPSIGFIDIGKEKLDEMEFSSSSGEISFYAIPGADYATTLSAYAGLVGTQPLPPRWALGNLMSRFGYINQKQSDDIVHQMKKDSVPVDAIIFDLFWFGDSIQGTLGNLEWINKKAWPNPKKMMDAYSKQHIKTILITEPFVVKTSMNYDSSISFHAVDSLGKPFYMNYFYFGRGGLLDLFRKDAQQWFFNKYKKQMSNGVSGWWGDLGEPETHPSDMYHNLKDMGFDRLFSANEIHNIYGHYWSKMLFENFTKTYPTKRLFNLNRSGYAGTAKYAIFPWSGDVSRSWGGLQAQLPLLQGMSISGIPYIHSDAGGFAGGDGDAELYVRWLQFAAFTPIFRPHGTALGNLDANAKNIPSEAALWQEPIKSLAKNAIKMRYRWLPYNYTLSYNQTSKGKPLMMPMFFLDESDENLYQAKEQYLWGDQVMVVPILEKEQTIRRYYMPKGNWTNVQTMQTIKGGRWIQDSSINMNGIPVFAKEGAFIPMAADMQHTDAYPDKMITIHYFPSAKPSEYEWYEDDGQDPNAISKKSFEITRLSCKGLGKTTTIEISSNGGKYPGQQQKRKLKFSIPNIQNVSAVLINGQKITQPFIDKSINGIGFPIIFEHKKIVVSIVR